MATCVLLAKLNEFALNIHRKYTTNIFKELMVMKMNDTENFVYALRVVFLMYSTLDLISAALETVGLTITILFLCILARIENGGKYLSHVCDKTAHLGSTWES